MVLIDSLFVLSGIGLLYGKQWARMMATIILIIGTIYEANEFAWGFAGGSPILLTKLHNQHLGRIVSDRSS